MDRHREAGGGVHRPGGADDEADAGTPRCLGRTGNCGLREHLSEPDNVRTEQGTALGASGEGCLRQSVRRVRMLDNVLASGAAVLLERPMEPDRAGSRAVATDPLAGLLVEPIDVLRHQSDVRPGEHPARKGEMTGVGCAAPQRGPPSLVPLPHQTGVAGECLRSGEVLGSVPSPQATRPAKGRDSRFSADPRTRQDQDRSGPRDQGPCQGEVRLRQGRCPEWAVESCLAWLDRSELPRHPFDPPHHRREPVHPRHTEGLRESQLVEEVTGERGDRGGRRAIQSFDQQ